VRRIPIQRRGYFIFNREWTSPPKKKIIPSPKLSKEEQNKLSYPPDILPGAQDVVSPVSQSGSITSRVPALHNKQIRYKHPIKIYSQYGTIRVYEFGPDNGRKVLVAKTDNEKNLTTSDKMNSDRDPGYEATALVESRTWYHDCEGGGKAAELS
jgi:hypothetical protein